MSPVLGRVRPVPRSTWVGRCTARLRGRPHVRSGWRGGRMHQPPCNLPRLGSSGNGGLDNSHRYSIRGHFGISDPPHGPTRAVDPGSGYLPRGGMNSLAQYFVAPQIVEIYPEMSTVVWDLG